MHPEIDSALKERGEDWVVAAMVEGSIGYHSPDSARRIFCEYQGGARENWCERCDACFDRDLEKMILHDVRGFQYLEQANAAKAGRIVEFCRKWETNGDNTPFNSLGLLYPTMNI